MTKSMPLMEKLQPPHFHDDFLLFMAAQATSSRPSGARGPTRTAKLQCSRSNALMRRWWTLCQYGVPDIELAKMRRATDKL